MEALLFGGPMRKVHKKSIRTAAGVYINSPPLSWTRTVVSMIGGGGSPPPPPPPPETLIFRYDASNNTGADNRALTGFVAETATPELVAPFGSWPAAGPMVYSQVSDGSGGWIWSEPLIPAPRYYGSWGSANDPDLALPDSFRVTSAGEVRVVDGGGPNSDLPLPVFIPPSIFSDGGILRIKMRWKSVSPPFPDFTPSTSRDFVVPCWSLHALNQTTQVVGQSVSSWRDYNDNYAEHIGSSNRNAVGIEGDQSWNMFSSFNVWPGEQVHESVVYLDGTSIRMVELDGKLVEYQGPNEFGGNYFGSVSPADWPSLMFIDMRGYSTILVSLIELTSVTEASMAVSSTTASVPTGAVKFYDTFTGKSSLQFHAPEIGVPQSSMQPNLFWTFVGSHSPLKNAIVQNGAVYAGYNDSYYRSPPTVDVGPNFAIEIVATTSVEDGGYGSIDVIGPGDNRILGVEWDGYTLNVYDASYNSIWSTLVDLNTTSNLRLVAKPASFEVILDGVSRFSGTWPNGGQYPTYLEMYLNKNYEAQSWEDFRFNSIKVENVPA